MAPLAIIQTSDLHNHLDLRRAGRLRTLRIENRALLLDCGDAIWAGNVFVKPGPEPAIRRMNEAGYHAMAAGNREFFFRSFGMMMKTAEARFPVLCANLIPRGDLGHILRWAILDSPSGERVGVFGLMPLMIPPGSWEERFSDMRFITHRQATEDALEALRADCAFVICLSHAGIETDIELAREFGQIDLILGGHSHLEDRELFVENGVTVSHVPPYGKAAGLITSTGKPAPDRFLRRMIPLL